MPEMDGFSVAEAIRASPDLAPMPAIMLTSDLRHGDAARLQNLGIRKHVSKPVRRTALVNAVGTALLGKSPSSPDQPAIPASSAQAAGQGASEELTLAGRILLAEDLEDNRDIVTLFLKGTAYELTCAEHGARAVELFQSGTYNVVLMDIQMPVMDGYSATRAIRDWERTQGRPPTPIVALTANAFQDEVDKSLAAGCSSHLTKPIKKKVLLEAIRMYASSRPEQEAA
jgi:CheY-like chemotaxis protein